MGLPLVVFLAGVLALEAPSSQGPPRARELGIPFAFGDPGPFNAITDVTGVEVGHVTLIEGDGVRTGVTAVLPRGRGRAALEPCFAGTFSLNGNGEMTGVPWVEESGLLEGPVLITNTNSVGVVRDAVIQFAARHWAAEELWSLPVVAETWDGYLNDIYASRVRPDHAFEAIENAAPGRVAEGNVGGGTGMICYEFKGGIGTASRRLALSSSGYTVGVLVQANFGLRHQLLVAGIPVGLELKDHTIYSEELGSFIAVVATDAPLLPHQLRRLARRVSLGLARTGSVSSNGSGDLFIAFSTANPRAGDPKGTVGLTMLPNERMGPLFEATVGAAEEAILNALVAARSMTGYKGHTVVAMPLEKVQEILRRHGRLLPPQER